MAEPSIQVLEYWFGCEHDIERIIKDKADLWWKKAPEVDRKIAERFGLLHNQAASGELNAWMDDPKQRLALIILLDQLSRNMFRDTAEAFKSDNQALAITTDGIERGMDSDLRPIERVFFYMPLEHSESIEIQDKSVDMFKVLVQEVPDELKDRMKGYLDFALEHQHIIQRFGRFPHRNKLLNRESSTEEIEFLTKPGSSF
jgi:uncharacterized protein (DUF924 family)